MAPSDAKPVTCAAAARSLAETIRQTTLDAAGGRTYAETELYLDAAGNPLPTRSARSATSVRMSRFRTPRRCSGCSRPRFRRP
jgi:hypothetical protein